MKGIIVIWSGAIVDIPAGWHLCDGAAGTPDLRNRFVMGAGDSFDPGDTGGALTHAHDFTSDTHFHTVQSPGTDIGAGVDYHDYTNSVAVVGTTDAENHLPPYYALAYIMKL